ncbi:MAG: hypothetical protein ACR2NA_03010 [Solirubrobacterales bacterium]
MRPTDLVGSFFVAGIAMLLAAAVAGVYAATEPWAWGRWLALHLAFVGGVSQLVLGASQFFAGAFLATERPGRRLIRAQLGAWNLGTILLAVGVPADSSPLLWLAAALLLSALGLYHAGLSAMQRRSLQTVPWATRWYRAAAGLLAAGIVAGVLVAEGAAWSWGNLLAAHMSLNVAGWFGTAIVGTLHTFYPSLTRTALALPRLQAPTFAAWVGGTLALATGYGWGVDPLAIGGWIALAGATALLCVNMAASLRAAPRPLSLPARMLTAGQLLLVAGLAVVVVGAIGSGPGEALAGTQRAAVGTLLVAGWIGLTVLGSLLHLLAVVVRVHDASRPLPSPRPGIDSAVVVIASLAALGLGAAQLGGLDMLHGVTLVVLMGIYLLLGVRVLSLARQVLSVARPRV